MADALLQPADDDSDEGGARASPHFTNLRQSSKKMECLNVSNEERVKEFLLGRIRKLHQMSNKEVAKAWIRGICPKKQTHFPYRNHDREAQGVPPQVPGWWPPTAPSRGIDLSNISSCASHADEHYRALGLKYCSFVEPDHMKKHERDLLLLHLLRLRPTPEQLQAWNKGLTKPSETHRLRGWTAFLKDLAPVESLDGISPTHKKDHRRQLFKEIYDVAEMEQEWKELGIDRQFHFTSDPGKIADRQSTRIATSTASANDKSASNRSASVEVPAPNSVAGLERSSPTECELPQPLTQLSSSTDGRMTETRHEDFLTLPSANDVDVAVSEPSASRTSEGSRSSLHGRKRTILVPVRQRTRTGNSGQPARKRKREASLQPSHTRVRHTIEQSRQQWQQWWQWWQFQAKSASLNESLGDAGVNDGPVYDRRPPAAPSSFFPGNRGSVFAHTPQYHQHSHQHIPTTQQSQLHVYNAMHVPPSHFEPAPYRAEFSRSSFDYSQDSQTANLPMPNYGVPMGTQSILPATAPLPYLGEQSHPIQTCEGHDGRPTFCAGFPARDYDNFQQMPQRHGEAFGALNQPNQGLFSGAFSVQNLPLQCGGPATGTIGCF